MGKIAQIFRANAAEYIKAYPKMPRSHKKSMAAIMRCRTPEAGIAVYSCSKCHSPHKTYLGCGNRHCPNCQQAKSQAWLQRALDRQLPGPYFMVTFTVPQQARKAIRSNQKLAYSAMFQASSEVLKQVIANEKYCGADLAGFFGILHTWGRTMQYHPHIHYVVPAGGIVRETGLWRPTKGAFLAPVKAMSKMFRAKMAERLSDLDLAASVWTRGWNVNVQYCNNNTEGVLRYLATYVFRVAITDSRILSWSEQGVTFRYRPSHSKASRTMTLHPQKFIARFLQHVLPTGFMKVRYYGFLSPGSRQDLDKLAVLVRLAHPEMPVHVTKRKKLPAPEPMRCRHCKAVMVLAYVDPGDCLGDRPAFNRRE